MLLRILMIILIFCCTSPSFADNILSVADGIDAYKSGDYELCIMAMKELVKKDPANSLGYYYLALAYSKTGKNFLAVRNYNKVIALGSDKALVDLAKRGKVYIGSGDVTALEAQIEDITEEIKDSSSFKEESREHTSEALKSKYEEKILNSLSGSQPAKTAKSPNTDNGNKPPTNDEIVNAIRILQRAGLLPNGLSGFAGSNYIQDSKTRQLNEMLMMLGQKGNNGVTNMLPYMNNGSNQISPQMIQMMMMNQMTPDFSSGY